ncbi:MAG: ABC transporter ATP-binding protein [Alicyclobacillus sp.]|nr:ABC transporter ATP-binding protein [Alicyclobacillus sp.]
MTTAVETVHLSKSFAGTAALRDISLAIPSQSIYGVVGANGAGKSTLLRTVIGLYRPDAGDVRVFGTSVPAEAAALRQRIQYVSPDSALPGSFRVDEMIRFTRMVYDRFDADRALRLLKALELPADRRIRALSLGMTMQLRLLLALSTRPELLLLDEPTTGLDPVVRRQFLQLILQEASSGHTTVVLATHHLADVERLVDGMAIFYAGRVVRQGMMEELQRGIKRVQALIDKPISLSEQELNQLPDVLSHDQVGRVHTFVTDKNPEALAAKLTAAGASFVEVVNVDLDELFTHVMRKEGYARDGILLS